MILAKRSVTIRLLHVARDAAQGANLTHVTEATMLREEETHKRTSFACTSSGCNTTLPLCLKSRQAVMRRRKYSLFAAVLCMTAAILLGSIGYNIQSFDMMFMGAILTLTAISLAVHTFAYEGVTQQHIKEGGRVRHLIR